MEPIVLELFRHGNTFEADDIPVWVGSRTDLPLTQRGRAQAEAAAKYLANGKPVDAIYTGVLSRQCQAGEILSDFLEPKPELFTGSEALNEIDYGEWEGLTSEEISSRWPDEFADWSNAAVWPESVFTGSLDNRVRLLEAWLDTLRSTYPPGARIAAVSSNGILRFFYRFLGSPWDVIVSEKRMGELKVKTGNCCRIHVHPQHIEVLSWNKNPGEL